MSFAESGLTSLLASSALFGALFVSAIANDDAIPSFRPQVAAYVGPTVPFSPLRVGFLPRVEAGVATPAFQGRLAVAASLATTHPTVEGTNTDAGLPENSQWTMRAHIWQVGLGARFAFASKGRLSPEAFVVPQVHILRAVTKGSGDGADFGVHEQEATKFGAYVGGGTAISLGPGQAVAHLGVHLAGIDGYLTGASNLAGFSPSIGYRMTL